jgi:hypothetical protein
MFVNLPVNFSDLTLQLALQLQIYTPPDKETIIFPCTPTLSGRLYPNPANWFIHVLDFLDSHGTRVHDTGLIVYDRDIQGGGKRIRLRHADALDTPGHQGTIDLFFLSTARVLEIADGNDQRLKVISFNYLDSSVPVPVFE